MEWLNEERRRLLLIIIRTQNDINSTLSAIETMMCLSDSLSRDLWFGGQWMCKIFSWILMSINYWVWWEKLRSPSHQLMINSLAFTFDVTDDDELTFGTSNTSTVVHFLFRYFFFDCLPVKCHLWKVRTRTRRWVSGNLCGKFEFNLSHRRNN